MIGGNCATAIATSDQTITSAISANGADEFAQADRHDGMAGAMRRLRRQGPALYGPRAGKQVIAMNSDK